MQLFDPGYEEEGGIVMLKMTGLLLPGESPARWGALLKRRSLNPFGRPERELLLTRGGPHGPPCGGPHDGGPPRGSHGGGAK